MPTRRGKTIALMVGAVAVAVLAVAVWLSWPQLRFWWRFESIGMNAEGFPEYRHRQTGIIFVRVPGGTFWMGAQAEDPKGPNYDPDARKNEGPVHEVTLSPFLMAKYEVRQTEWDRVMGSNPSEFKGADLPVENVSWDECHEFCRKTGLKLPTEAHWEYACRAGTRTAFASGETITPEQVNYDGDQPYGGAAPGLYRRKTVAVTSFEPNGFGLHQMHGNVCEWCEDVYDPGFYASPEARQKDPVCTSGSGIRVFRGGGWEFDAGVCRSACRYADDPADSDFGLGLRAANYPLP